MSGTKQTVFITGASTGIGAGLARAFHARGARVIISGRNRAGLEALADDCSGMEVEMLDVADTGAVTTCAGRIAVRHPDLNLLINNAGVQKLLSFADEEPIAAEDLDAEIDINLRGLIHVSNAFLPLLKRQPSARLVQVSSALAFVPLVAAPVYSASKAAVRAFTVALREQLKDSNVQVVELIPPAVKTELHRGQTRRQIRQMSLQDFVAAAMRGLDSGKDEIAVGLAKAAWFGSRVAPGRLLKVVNKPV
jgi:uncharacterized oxidoreductase